MKKEIENAAKISHGNRKMGDISSVSMPRNTCDPKAPCWKNCYAKRFYDMYPNVRASYQHNYALFASDPAAYFNSIVEACKNEKWFRYHVCGDIANYEYFKGMIDTARKCPGTTFLCFTKKYSIVNKWVRYNKLENMPKNLVILFSYWDRAWNATIDNRYSFPECHVILKSENDSAANYDHVCGGNCTECACHGVGRWNLKHGEAIAIIEH